MEEEFREIVVDTSTSHDMMDPTYEFDAPRFFDLSLPEDSLHALQAQQWFQPAHAYPPSPIVLKEMRLKKGLSFKGVCEKNGTRLNAIISDDSGQFCVEKHVPPNEDDDRGKTKSLFKSGCSKMSTFMKPTASHLAKQRNPSEALTTPQISRSTSMSSTDYRTTKRQKLEAGYLRRIAQLKHQPPFTHKKPKVDAVDISSSFKPKLTIPKQFNLETAHRAQRHKSKTNNQSDECSKSSSHMFKALPLNKKILEGPSLSFKKQTLQLTEFNVFHFETSKRAMQLKANNVAHNFNCSSSSIRETKDLRRQNSNDKSRQDKRKLESNNRGSPEKLKLSRKGERSVFQNIRQENVMEINDKRLSNEPPSELFSKLYLDSEVRQTITKKQTLPASKGLKENVVSNLHLQNESMSYIKEDKQTPCVKQYLQCINERPDVNQACM